MHARDDEFLGVRVETASGRFLGRLVGFILDTETGFVVQYRVRPKGIIAMCFPGIRELLIAHDQVVSLDTRRMIVRDVVGEIGRSVRHRRAPAMNPQPLSSESE